MTEPEVSVLIPTYRQPEVLVQTLRDLNAQNYPTDLWEVIILDDGSGDVSDSIAIKTVVENVPVTLKRYPPASGGKNEHANLFNELLRLSSPDSDLFVHIEDVRFRSDFLKHHAKWYTADNKMLVTGPMCEGHTETFNPEACDRWELMEASDETNSASAYRCGFRSVWAKSMSYTRNLVKRLTELGGGSPFDGNMSNWGYHEVEFAYRATNHADADCVYDINCAVYHPGHNPRDERRYRGFNRRAELRKGEEENIDYICKKHNLTELPPWKAGEPIESPSLEL